MSEPLIGFHGPTENQSENMAPQRLFPVGWTTDTPPKIRAWLKIDRLTSRRHVMDLIKRFSDEALTETEVGARRHRVLCLCELALRHRRLIGETTFQKLVDSYIGVFERSGVNTAYPKRLWAVSDARKLRARREYAEFFFTGLVGSDCARLIAGHV